MTPDDDDDRWRLQWTLALAAIELLAADPDGLKGLVIHGAHGPVRDHLITLLERRLAVRRVPVNIDDDSLTGGLDVTATLAAGRRIMADGLLTGAGGCLLVIGAERLPPGTMGTIARWLEHAGSVASDTRPRPPALVLLDESLDDESGITDSVLGERLALQISLPELSLAQLRAQQAQRLESDSIDTAVQAVADVAIDDTLVREITSLAATLGVDSSRAVLLTLRAAQSAAWRARRTVVTGDDAALAVQLVLSPRARCAPADADAPAQDPDHPDDTPPDETHDPAPDDQPEPPPQPATNEAMTADDHHDDHHDDRLPDDPSTVDALPERLIDAARAALPSSLLASLARGQQMASRHAGREAGGAREGSSGRPIGVRRPRDRRARRGLDLLATLKAAAPRQRLRGRTPSPSHSRSTTDHARPIVRADDLRVTRYRQPVRTTTVFVVDASGSAAMHRLAEAKGAVELLLAECYVRRDRVALITFRGSSATLDLPPTRSLTRAKRCLSGLPGGGGTPLASGLDLACDALRQLQLAGEIPVAIVMTDGKANIARDGTPDRRLAAEDAEDASRRLAATGARLMFIDTGPRPRASNAHLATIMQARYLPLPQARANDLPSLIAGA